MPPNSNSSTVTNAVRHRSGKPPKNIDHIKCKDSEPKPINACNSAKATPDKTNPKRNVAIKMIAVGLVAVIAGFYALPWERWVFVNEIQLRGYMRQLNDEADGEVHVFLATAEQHLDQTYLHEVNCSVPGYWRERQINAAPTRCGLLMYDELVTPKEAQRLRELAGNLTEEIGDSSPYIRESLNLRWINLHQVFRKGARRHLFNEKDYQLVRKTGEKAKKLVSEIFGIPDEWLLFSNVSQFTRYRQVAEFSEFRHVDKVRTPSLIVTSILWLSTVDVDFVGGRTEFLTGGPEPFTPLLVDPKLGRYAAWTSSYENPHSVLEVFAGERLGLIFGFTVNSALGHESIDHLRHWAVAYDELNIH